MTASQTNLLTETFPIRLPDGTDLVGSLYKVARGPGRRAGRRIVVQDAGGRQLFDTGDQYDRGNAAAALDEWLAGWLKGGAA